MKSIGEILQDLGFNKEASLETQKAFFKHLAQQAESKVLKSKNNSKTKIPKKSSQLEFDLSPSSNDGKKVS